MASLWDTARAQREDLIRADTATARDLADGYRRVHEGLEGELAHLYDRMDRAAAAGKPIGPAMLYQEGRLTDLLEQVERRVATFSRVAERRVESVTRSSALEGVANGAELVDRATPDGTGGTASSSFTRLRDDALNAAVAQAGPVSRALEGLGADEARALEEILTSAVGRGRNPREVARELSRVTTMPLNRALTVARTEQLRAYRAGSHLTFQANADALEGWTWISAADRRTCAACFAMHGSVHTLEEPMSSHPNCRCVPAPLSRPWSAFGLDDDGTPQRPTDGPTLFRKLKPRDQDAILGRGGGEAYRRGEVSLEDFVTRRSHPLYGESVTRSGLRAARERAGMRMPEAGRTAPTVKPAPRPAPTPATAPAASAPLELEQARQFLPALEARAGELERIAGERGAEVRRAVKDGAKAMRDSWTPEARRSYGVMGNRQGAGARGRHLSSGEGGAGGRDLGGYAFNAGNENSWHYRDGKRLNLEQYGDLWLRWSRGDTMGADFVPPRGVEPATPEIVEAWELVNDLEVQARADRHIVEVLSSDDSDWRFEPRDRAVALGRLTRNIADGQVVLGRALRR